MRTKETDSEINIRYNFLKLGKKASSFSDQDAVLPNINTVCTFE